ncbi:hypothetical protein QA612_03790 [Evansella sp. AB-P1]|uniref:hypothetical protein n=1 Tax=Evansella sp. AB-P1 TaxID=3037653 RepID=UPI00241E17E2|nr:hypothetical protein [Evansella sp. AB-P1]MDG5786600.1 hypothetical protein [Evansella sp. AB-P1]
MKKRFAVTEEVASVPAKSEKEICRHRGSSHRSCKESKGLAESFLATAFHDFLLSGSQAFSRVLHLLISLLS